MYEPDLAVTVAISACRSCGTGLFEESKFCRLCGERQTHKLAPPSSQPTPIRAPEIEPVQNYETTKLSVNLYHPISGPLVKAVASGVPTSDPRSPAAGFSKRMLLALMAIPIWVMIILLSPLDAYASAKIIGNRI